MSNVVLLGLVSFFTDISSEMVYPLLPIFVVQILGASPALLGLIEGIAESLSSLVRVFSGYWSDRLRTRKVITICGYTLSLIGKFFLYLSVSLGLVFWARIFDRLGKGIRASPRDALIAESSSYKNRGRSFGLHRMMDTLGACLGITFAYLFFVSSHGDYKRLFFIALIPAALGIIVLCWVKDKYKSRLELKDKAQKISLRRIFSQFNSLDKRLKAFLIIAFVFSLANSSNLFLLLRAKSLGFDIKLVILAYLSYNIAYALSSYPAGFISDKIGRKTLLVCGYIFYSLVYFGFALVGPSSFIWVLFILYGIYIGLTEGVEKAFISDLSPRDLKGTFIGMHATLVGVGLFPASLIAGILWNVWGAQAPFVFGAVVSFAAAMGLVRYI